MKKKDLLKKVVEHIDIKAINAVEMIEAMKKMSFSARDLANAADIYDRMLKEKNIKVTRIAKGVPMGGDLKYLDKIPAFQDPVGGTIKDYFIQPWILSGKLQPPPCAGLGRVQPLQPAPAGGPGPQLHEPGTGRKAPGDAAPQAPGKARGGPSVHEA